MPIGIVYEELSMKKYSMTIESYDLKENMAGYSELGFWHVGFLSFMILAQVHGYFAFVFQQNLSRICISTCFINKWRIIVLKTMGETQ